MNKYTELKSKHEKLVNDFPLGFAFSKKQFEEMKVKLNVTSDSELFSLSNGGFIHKTDSDKYHSLMLQLHDETEKAMRDYDYVYHGFLYELGNHEYCITYDPESTLDCFNLTIEQVENDERLKSIFKKARQEYLSHCE